MPVVRWMSSRQSATSACSDYDLRLVAPGEPTAIVVGRAPTHGVQPPYVRDRQPLTDSPVPGPACRYYLPRLDDRPHVPIGQWTMATLRMNCPTGGLTPCSAATGIPGRPATSSSPTCRARAALTKASPGTPWSGARQAAAAQPGTARDTTRPTRRPPAPLGSQAGSHHHQTQGDPESTEAFDTSAATRHSATVADGSRQTGSRSHRGAQALPLRRARRRPLSPT